MRFSLVPQEHRFFDLFDELAAILTRASERLLALVSQFDRLSERSYEIRQDESACDEVVARTVEAAESCFITPFDRENIHGLARAVNAVPDAIEEAAYRFETFRIERPSDEARLLARIAHDCCTHLAGGLTLLRHLANPDPIQGHVREVFRLEKEGDRVYRERDSDLFAHPPEVLVLLQWRELYAVLRNVLRACLRVAQTLSEIVIKGS